MPPSLNFPQLDFVKPSSGFHPVTWERVMLEFLNIFLIKGVDIVFGHKDKVYVISKQLIIDVFGICAEGYIKDLKG